jgi:hypothetical protein
MSVLTLYSIYLVFQDTYIQLFKFFLMRLQIVARSDQYQLLY